MINPVTNYLATQTRKRVIFILLWLNIAIIAPMSVIGAALKPYTIVDFELAGSMERANDMLIVWKDAGVMPSLFFVLGFDYVFMVVYSFSLWFVCLHVANVVKGLTRFMIFLAWCQPVAAVLDAIENAALFQIASGSVNTLWPAVSWWCAIPKFVIAFTGVTFWIVLAIMNLYRRVMKSP